MLQLQLVVNYVTLTCLCLNAGRISAKELSKYGEKCQGEHPSCNSEHSLVCANHICTCINGAFHDDASDKCTGKIGQPCKIGRNITLPCPANSACVQHNPFAFSYAYAIAASQQVEFSVIAKQHLCKCRTGYASSSTAQGCIEVLGYGKACTKTKGDLYCDYTQALVCGQEKTCSCDNPTEKTYDKKSQKCVKILGAKCAHDEQCEVGAMCSAYAFHIQMLNAATDIQKREVLSQFKNVGGPKCICSFGNLLSSDLKKCVGNYGSACSAYLHCNPDGHLKCIDGICQCGKGTSEVFGTTSCHLLVGSMCDDKSGPSCVGNATCEDGHCELECEEGLSPTKAGICLGSYSTSCEIPTGQHCNHKQGLACVDEECTCFDLSLKWDKKAKMCVAKTGSRCGKFDAKSNVLAKGVATAKALLNVGISLVEHYYVGCESEASCRHDETTGTTLCEKN